MWKLENGFNSRRQTRSKIPLNEEDFVQLEVEAENNSILLDDSAALFDRRRSGTL